MEMEFQKQTWLNSTYFANKQSLVSNAQLGYFISSYLFEVQRYFIDEECNK